MNKKVIGGLIFGIIIFLICFLVGYHAFLNPKLQNFKIELTKKNDIYTVSYPKNKNALKYEIEILNSDDEVIHTETSKDIEVVLDDFISKYNQDLSIRVFAIDKNDTKKRSSNIIDFVWDNPSFTENHVHYVETDQDFFLEIMGGDLTNHQLKILFENEIIYETNLNEKSVYIPYNKLQNYSGKLIAEITKNNAVYDKLNFYVNTVLVGNVKIDSPVTNESFVWTDLNFKYSGGVNANNVYLNLYTNGKLVNKIEVTGNAMTLPADIFTPETYYKIEIRAVYEDYEEIAKNDFIDLYIGKIVEVGPVFLNYNHENIKSGTKVALSTKTANAVIKYTTDGTNPKTNGIVYEEPIIIDKNIIIKTYAEKYRAISSQINEYNFNINDNFIPKIYLSPSNQTYNYGAKNSGFTSEYQMMNKIADIVEKRLKEFGVIVFRNNPRNDIMDYVHESSRLNADFHFAIHSNGSIDHNINGVEIFVHEQTSPALSISNKIYDNLYSIYPYQSDFANRGVKFAEGLLGEVNKANVKSGALIEIAFHDDYNDAIWIVNNLEKIAINLADSILEYYQVK